MIATMLWSAAIVSLSDARVPSRRDVQEIESGLALVANIEAVGVIDSAALNRASRVRIRALRCTPAGVNRAVCSYWASICLEGESDDDRDGWCVRTTRFARIPPTGMPGVSRKGWAAVR